MGLTYRITRLSWPRRLALLVFFIAASYNVLGSIRGLSSGWGMAAHHHLINALILIVAVSLAIYDRRTPRPTEAA